MKVFISQPMKDRTQEEIEDERDKLMEVIKDAHQDENVTEIASYFGAAAKFTPLESLGLSIQMMNRADVVIFAPGWEDARGCRIERECAKQYGIDIVDVWRDSTTGKFMRLFPGVRDV